MASSDHTNGARRDDPFGAVASILAPHLIHLDGKAAKTDCIRWSSDARHALVVLEEVIHILTPAIGIHPSIPRHIAPVCDPAQNPSRSLECFHSSIQIDEDTLPPARKHRFPEGGQSRLPR